MLSGGLDSAVALYWALDRGFQVETITFDYFHRSAMELIACKKLAKITGSKNRLIELNFLREIEDVKSRVRNRSLKGSPSAYIPCRNMIFYGIAASFAEVLDMKYIIGGHNKDDIVNFPDSSGEFFSLFNKTASIGRISGDRTGRVLLPLARLSKTEVVKLGAKLEVPFEHTWSCYKSGKIPCGKCHACALRKNSFGSAGLQDPLVRAHS